MLPLIKVEFENIRQCMVHAFSEYQLKLDQDFNSAIKAACKPEVVEALLHEAAAKYLREAIDEETKAFFSYGKGRELVKAEVKKRLLKELK